MPPRESLARVFYGLAEMLGVRPPGTGDVVPKPAASPRAKENAATVRQRERTLN
jgi:hypothetical protein